MAPRNPQIIGDRPRWCVYKLWSVSSEFVYVGQTRNLNARFNKHMSNTNSCASRHVVETSEKDEDVRMEALEWCATEQEALGRENALMELHSNCGQRRNRLAGFDKKAVYRRQFRTWLDTGDNRKNWNAYMCERRATQRAHRLQAAAPH